MVYLVEYLVAPSGMVVVVVAVDPNFVSLCGCKGKNFLLVKDMGEF